MKWRNQLLALFCLIAFLAFGVFYFQAWVVQKPFGIILFVVEGLDPARLTLARQAAGASSSPLAIDSLTHTALLKRRLLATETSGVARSNLLALARESGRMTALVTNGSLTDATPAIFYAPKGSPGKREDLARALVEKGEIDVVLGGGIADFLPTRKGGRRTDERDLLLELRGTGYELVQDLEELEAVARWRRAKLFGAFPRVPAAPASDDAETAAKEPTLADMVRRSIELLQFNSDGYVLVVNVAFVDNEPPEDATEGRSDEMVALDRALAVALEYAGAKSMIIVGGEMIAFGSGLGADALHGTMENTDVFETIRDNL